MTETRNAAARMTYQFSDDELADIFTQWDTLYRANPDAFANEAARLLTGTADEYGPQAAATFLAIRDGSLARELKVSA